LPPGDDVLDRDGGHDRGFADHDGNVWVVTGRTN
jgi:hypothetical protein